MIFELIEKEKITFRKLFNPMFVFRLLYKYKYIHFFITGMSGVILNLLVTWITTEFILGGDEYYFYGYLKGLTCNLIYNFILHTIIIFKTTKKHLSRFVWFVIYSLIMSAIQAVTIKYITDIVGTEYYLLVIAAVIITFSTITFMFFKLKLFKEEKNVDN